MSIQLQQIRDLVIIPALTAIGHAEPAAVRLVLGTGLVESNYEYLAQDGGPALGFWQMEPATCNDLFTRFLYNNSSLHSDVVRLTLAGDLVSQLTWNLKYAAAMCRVKYLSIPVSLPNVDDLEGMAAYWLKFYNAGGAGTIERFMSVATQSGLMDL